MIQTTHLTGLLDDETDDPGAEPKSFANKLCSQSFKILLSLCLNSGFHFRGSAHRPDVITK